MLELEVEGAAGLDQDALRRIVEAYKLHAEETGTQRSR